MIGGGRIDELECLSALSALYDGVIHIQMKFVSRHDAAHTSQDRKCRKCCPQFHHLRVVWGATNAALKNRLKSPEFTNPHLVYSKSLGDLPITRPKILEVARPELSVGNNWQFQTCGVRRRPDQLRPGRQTWAAVLAIGRQLDCEDVRIVPTEPLLVPTASRTAHAVKVFPTTRTVCPEAQYDLDQPNPRDSAHSRFVLADVARAW